MKQARFVLAIASWIAAGACAAVLATSPAQAGGKEVGNGGGAVFCAANASGPDRVEVLDLMEARVLYGLTISAPEPSRTDLERAWEVLAKLEAVAPTYYQWASAFLDEIGAHQHFVGPGVGLTQLDDTFTPVLPLGCEIRQLANYSHEWGLLLDPKLWAGLDANGRAALFVHEAIYAVERRLRDAPNSVYARRIVAYLFSDVPFTAELWSSLKES